MTKAERTLVDTTLRELLSFLQRRDICHLMYMKGDSHVYDRVVREGWKAIHKLGTVR